MSAVETVRPDADTLAADRSVMAAQRTLMAWVRTALSLIGFGFTIYKFLELEYRKDATVLGQAFMPTFLEGPRNFGLTFIGLAVCSLAIALIQHRQYTKRMGRGGGLPRFDLTLVMAGFVAAIGLLAFANVVFRVGPF
jgi:putative membrane protein